MESKSKIEDTFENFKIIEEINEKFICKCSKLLIQPKLCFSCSTSFCKSCQMDRGMCPDCGEKLVINLHVDQKIGNLRIKCLVCGEELNVEEIEKHRKEEKEKKEKEEEVVECEGCLLKLNVGLIEGHQKECCAFLLKRINYLNELVEEMQFKAKDYRDKWQKALLEKELLEKKEEPKIQDDPKEKQKKKEIERLLLCFKHMDSGDLERAKKICLEKILEGNKCAKALKYYCGWGINKNVKKALELFCELAEEDKERKNELTPFSLFWVGFIYHQGAGGVKKDIKKAIEFYEKAAKLNHLDAMFYLATIYHKGEIGVKKEVKKAIELYDKAIQFGHTDSIFTLGFIYHKGEEGFKPDVKKAIQIYEKGVSLNDTDALFYLAEIYQNGEGGVKKDIKKAIQLYEKAVLLNNSDAMFNLAQIYQSGDGVQKDLNKAIQLYKRSSELGNEQAMFCLFLLSNNKK